MIAPYKIPQDSTFIFFLFWVGNLCSAKWVSPHPITENKVSLHMFRHPQRIIYLFICLKYPPLVSCLGRPRSQKLHSHTAHCHPALWYQ